VIARAEITDAPDYVADALRLSEGSRSIVRERIISREESGTTEIATSWWPASLADHCPRLLEPTSLGGMGSVRYVESATGRVATYARDQVAARLATEQEADRLNVQLPAAVLTYRHVVYDRQDQPLEFAEAVYPPDVWTIEQEYPID
jgi:DNA-binding GntR family transcriptional regulator